MKHLLKNSASLVLLLFMTFFISCANSSSSDNNQVDMEPETETENYLLQWDKNKNAFVGTVTWKANTVEEKVLLGYKGDSWGSDFVDSIIWEAITPYDCEYSDDYRHVTATSEYSINPNTNSLTANVRIDSNSFLFGVWRRWADVPNNKIRVTLKFTTGKSVIITEKNGWGKYEGYENENLNMLNPYNYIAGINHGNYKLAVYYGKGDSIKIKEAVIYLYEDDEMTQLKEKRTLSHDWSNAEWLSFYGGRDSYGRHDAEDGYNDMWEFEYKDEYGLVQRGGSSIGVPPIDNKIEIWSPAGETYTASKFKLSITLLNGKKYEMMPVDVAELERIWNSDSMYHP